MCEVIRQNKMFMLKVSSYLSKHITMFMFTLSPHSELIFGGTDQVDFKGRRRGKKTQSNKLNIQFSLTVSHNAVLYDSWLWFFDCGVRRSTESSLDVKVDLPDWSFLTTLYTKSLNQGHCQTLKICNACTRTWPLCHKHEEGRKVSPQQDVTKMALSEPCWKCQDLMSTFVHERSFILVWQKIWRHHDIWASLASAFLRRSCRIAVNVIIFQLLSLWIIWAAFRFING